MKSNWHRYFDVDLRALAAMRMALAATIVYDVITRWRFVDAMYTDDGMAPRRLFTSAWRDWFSPYMQTGGATGLSILFAIHLAFALMLLVGFRTRIATIACTIFTFAIAARNPSLVSGGDALTLWLLAWSCFLPLGAVASVDARTSAARSTDGNACAEHLRDYCSPASAALLLQVVVVYFGAAMCKLGTDWLVEFDAVHAFLNSSYGTPLGKMLARAPVITALLAPATVCMELLGAPTALLAGRTRPKLRTAIAVAFMMFHASLCLFLYIGTFAWVCVAMWLMFIPPQTWDALATKGWARALYRPIGALLDGVAKTLNGVIPILVVLRIGSCQHRLAGGFVILMGACVLPLAIIANLPAFVFVRLGPLQRLPKIKQQWTVMAEAWRQEIWISISATLNDGSTVELLPRVRAKPHGLDYVIPPENHRLTRYRFVSAMQAAGGRPALIEAICDYERRKWDAAHADASHVRTLICYCEIRKIQDLNQPPEASTFSRREIWRWPPATVAGK